MSIVNRRALAVVLGTLASFFGPTVLASEPGSAPALAPLSHQDPWEAGTSAWPAAHNQKMQDEWRARLEGLNLTADQRAAIKTIAERYQVKAWDLAQRGAGLREQLSAVSPDDPGYADATKQAANSAALIAADGIGLLSDLRSEVHAQLTAEQRQLLKEQSGTEAKRWNDWRARHRAAPQ